MNPNIIRERLLPHKGERVLVKIHGMRNKTDKFIGVMKEFYPHIFTIEVDNTIRSFSYSEIIDDEVVLTFI